MMKRFVVEHQKIKRNYRVVDTENGDEVVAQLHGEEGKRLILKVAKALNKGWVKPEPWFPETDDVALYVVSMDAQGVECVEPLDDEYMTSFEDVAEAASIYRNVIYFYVPKGGV